MKRNLTPTHTVINKTTIDQFASEKLIHKKAAKALKVETAKTSSFYMLPMVHKKNNPGRPIISTINNPTSSIAQFVDHHLQPIAEKLLSFVKDTGAFLRKINDIGTIPKISIQVTMDVASLYSNIPHRKGINATVQALENWWTPLIPTRVLIKFLSLFLHLNNFIFKVSGSLYSVKNRIKISSYDNSLISHLRGNQGVFSYWTHNRWSNSIV